MEEKVEVRKISTKMIVMMVITVILGIGVFFVVENGKSAKAAKVLNELGYTNIEDVRVYSITDVENMDTKIQGKKYFVKFKDLQTNKECKGFILKDFKHNVAKDLICE
jgi:hypothetical protein